MFRLEGRRASSSTYGDLGMGWSDNDYNVELDERVGIDGDRPNTGWVTGWSAKVYARDKYERETKNKNGN